MLRPLRGRGGTRRGRGSVRSSAGTLAGLEIDHVLIATRGLAEGSRALELRHGLTSVEGGRHPGWGTENRIVPLVDAYIELVSVSDPAQARRSSFGRWVSSASTHVLHPLGWAVRTDDLGGMARRLGLEVASGARLTPTGERLAWQTAGIDRAAAEPSLPFFIEWEQGSRLPGSADPPSARLSRLLLQGDPERLASWLGEHELPIEVQRGVPAVTAVALRRPAGEAVLVSMD